MSLSGTFSTMTLGHLLQWVDQGRKTGLLVVQGERYVKRIFTREGRIVASASSDPNDHLGHFLLRLGTISEPELRRALEIQQRGGAMLGGILVEIGALSGGELQQALLQKAEETVFSLFLWPQACFEFQPDVLPATLPVPLDLEINEVLLKGLAWYDELQHIREVIPSDRTVLARTERTLPAGHDGRSPLARRILELVDGRRCIADICLAVHASEFVVSRALHGFHEKGLVTTVARRERAQAPPRKTLMGLLEEARSLLRAGELEASLKILDEARPLAPHDFALNTLTREAHEAFTRQTYRNGLQPTQVPVLARPLESLTGEALTPEQMFILSRVDGTWDVRSIISVCPLPEGEALLHMMGLKEKGILELLPPPE